MLFLTSALLSTLLVFASSPFALASPTKVEAPRALQPRGSGSCQPSCPTYDFYTGSAISVTGSGGYTCSYIASSKNASSQSYTCKYASDGILQNPSVQCYKLLISSTCHRSFTEEQSEMMKRIESRQWSRAKANRAVSQKRR